MLSFRLTSLKNTPFKCHDAVQIASSLLCIELFDPFMKLANVKGERYPVIQVCINVTPSAKVSIQTPYFGDYWGDMVIF